MSVIIDRAKDFFGFTENGYKSDQPLKVLHKKPSVPGMRGTLIHFPQSKPVNAQEIVLAEPRSHEDSLNIATYLREGKPVVVNLKYLDTQSGKRLIDFVCGTAYAINGHMQKIGENIFVFTPETVLITDAEDKSTLEKGMDNAEKEVFFKKQAASY